jgi:NAD(P)-dependent dehydrogenase (short-subunit alcohol dehydrogenase family)
MASRLQDKVIVVTGASGYIGRTFAERVGQEGARVVLCDIRESPEALAAVRATGADALSLQVDVASEESTKEMARKSVERFGRIDGLLNNAGIIRGPGMEPRSLLDVDLDAWDRTLSVNVKGPFLCIRAVFPYMRDRGGGKIINIGSGTWLHTSRGMLSTPHYVASKGAVTGLTRALAPGATPPEGREQALLGPQFTDSERALGRVGLPEDLTGAMVFLFSEDSDFMTGQMLLVNGGMETW